MNRRHFLGLLAALPFARPEALAAGPLPTIRVGSYAQITRKTLYITGLRHDLQDVTFNISPEDVSLPRVGP